MPELIYDLRNSVPEPELLTLQMIAYQTSETQLFVWF